MRLSMKKNFRFAINCLMSLCLTGFCVFIFASSAYAAGTLLSSETANGTYHKSSGYNSDPDHQTTAWQELGYKGGLGDHGVSWSTDGGITWGHDDLYVGDTVTFSINMHSENAGSHYANFSKAWIDWGNSSDESYEFNSDNSVESSYKILRNSKDSGLNSGYSEDVRVTYTIELTEAYLGTAYLRARTTCSESIVTSNLGAYSEQYSYRHWYYGIVTGTRTYSEWDSQWYYNVDEYLNAFSAYSNYYQGEIEDWKITVLNRDSSGGTAPVPEPATLVLFGMGLLGVAKVSRKKV